MFYEILIPQRTVRKAGALGEIGRLVERRGDKAFLVTSSFLVDYAKTAAASLKEAGFDTKIGDFVDAEPDIAVVDKLTEDAKEYGADMVVSIGGGSVLDTGKAVALMINNPGSVREYLHGVPFGMFENRGVYSACVATTAGTGSEASPCSVVIDHEKQVKPNMLHQFLIPDLAVLDPELLLSLPKPIVAATGFDALTHAIEAYVSLWSNAATKMYSLEAIRCVAANLEKFVNSDDLEAAAELLRGSNLAGTAMNAATGIAHGIGQPIGAVYGISHGDAMSILLPISMEANLDWAVDAYGQVAVALGVDPLGKSPRETALAGTAKVREIAAAIGVKTKISECGDFSKDKFAEIVQSVNDTIDADNYCNPRPLTDELVLEILEKAF
ncbi:MAG TPA: iron-containing alcohol dehydrogenase [Firmicutes bacterium]|nr:iron-containing alcohol dehydrogenase [Bacillota bacterium]